MQDDVVNALLDMKETLGRVEGKIDSLAGPQGRVTALESAQARHQWMAWGKAIIASALALLGREMIHR